MMPAALLLAAAVTGRVTLFEEIVRIPRSQWRALNVSLQQRPATVEASYEVISGRSGVRVVLMTREDSERFIGGQSHRTLASSALASRGEFRYLIAHPGAYRVLLDNRLEGRGPAEVKLKVALAFHQYTSFDPRSLPPEHRRVIVAVSLLLFAAGGGWSGWKVLSAFRRKSSGLAPPFA